MAGDLGQVQASKPSDTSFGVERADSRQHGYDSEGCFEFSREDLDVDSILKPPVLFAPYVSLGRVKFSV